MKLLRFRLISFCAMLALAGCGGSSTTTPPPPTIGKAYVAANFSIMRFPAGGAGDQAPQMTLKLLPEFPGYLAVDVPHDRLVATAVGSIPEVVFVDNASTTMQPVRAISGPATTLAHPASIAVDSANDVVYVADGPTVLVFGPASTISGNVAPLRTISGAVSLSALALDASNRLFLSDSTGAINVFDNAGTLNGTVVPNRVIAGAATQLAIPGLMALDSSGRIIVANRSANGPSGTTNFLVFANAGSGNGNVAPAAVFTLAAIQTLFEMAVSPSGELYVVDGNSSLNVYSNIATASGNLVPVRAISGPNTGLNPPLGSPGGAVGIALDPTR